MDKLNGNPAQESGVAGVRGEVQGQAATSTHVSSRASIFKLCGAGLLLGFLTYAALMLHYRYIELNVASTLVRGLLLVLGTLLALGGAMAFNYGRRLSLIKAALHQTSTDERAPVLYLRSFKSEPWTSLVPISGPLVLSLRTEEEELSLLMNKIGPFTAIGMPGDELPVLGAKRIYIEDGDWKKRVEQLMKESRIVVLRAGDTGGFWWEVRKLMEIGKRPERILFLLPFGKTEYEVFRAKAETILPCRLPDYQRGQRAVGSLRGVLYFEPDWTPRFVKLKAPFGPRRLIRPVSKMLERGLSPFFNQLLINPKKKINYQTNATAATAEHSVGLTTEQAESIPGRYVNQKKRAEYIDLHPDSTFYITERKVKLGGSFAVQEGDLILTLSNGPAQSVKLLDGRIVDAEGKEWIKVSEVTGNVPRSRLVTTSSFPHDEPSREPFSSYTESASGTLAGFIGKKIARLALPLFLISLIAGAVQYYFSPRYVSGASWTNYNLPHTNLFVNLPCKPAFESESNEAVEKFYRTEPCVFKDLEVSVRYGIPKPQVVTGPSYVLYGFANGMEQHVRNLKGARIASGFTYFKFDISGSDERYRLKGSYTVSDVRREVEAVSEAAGRGLSLITVDYDASSDDARHAMTRIISSATFK